MIPLTLNFVPVDQCPEEWKDGRELVCVFKWGRLRISNTKWDTQPYNRRPVPYWANHTGFGVTLDRNYPPLFLALCDLSALEGK